MMTFRPFALFPSATMPGPAAGALISGNLQSVSGPLVLLSAGLGNNHGNSDLRATSDDRLTDGGAGNGGSGGNDGGRSGGGQPPGWGGPPRRPRFRMWRRFLGGSVALLLLGTATAGVLVWYKYAGLVSDLPTVEGLRTYQPPVMSRLYS
ncbi:MAG: hypothetical protein ABF824_15350, partial [Acetobacter sp.]